MDRAIDTNKRPISDGKANDCATSDNDDSSVDSKKSRTVISYDKLQHAVEKSMKRITSKSRFLPYIKEHFQSVYRADSKNVLELYKSMMNQMESMTKEEIQVQLSAHNVEQLLTELDNIKKENATCQRKWRPSGVPQEDVKAHLQESSQLELQQLEKILSTLESHNKMLNECVADSDKKLQASLKQIEGHCSAWGEAAAAVSDDARQDLIDMNLKLPGLQLNGSKE